MTISRQTNQRSASELLAVFFLKEIPSVLRKRAARLMNNSNSRRKAPASTLIDRYFHRLNTCTLLM